MLKAIWNFFFCSHDYEVLKEGSIVEIHNGVKWKVGTYYYMKCRKCRQFHRKELTC